MASMDPRYSALKQPEKLRQAMQKMVRDSCDPDTKGLNQFVSNLVYILSHDSAPQLLNQARLPFNDQYHRYNLVSMKHQDGRFRMCLTFSEAVCVAGLPSTTREKALAALMEETEQLVGKGVRSTGTRFRDEGRPEPPNSEGIAYMARSLTNWPREDAK